MCLNVTAILCNTKLNVLSFLITLVRMVFNIQTHITEKHNLNM